MSGLCLVGLIQLSARMIPFVRPACCLDKLPEEEEEGRRGGGGVNIGTLSTSHLSHLRSVVAMAPINNELSDHDPRPQNRSRDRNRVDITRCRKPLAAGIAILG
jgi:hypothetical protein